jgi:hypothetical protein
MHTVRGETGVSSPVLRTTYVFMVATTIAGTTAGLHLTFLTELTRTTFAWHIRNPMTAGFFGAAYVAAGIALAATLLRARRWEDLRIATVVATFFMTAAGIVTLKHLGEFQYDSDHRAAWFVSWVWLVLYFGLPVGLVYSLVRQELRTQPGSYLPERPLLPALRFLFAGCGLALVAVGIGLVLDVSAVVDAWPWSLPPLSARVVGAWVTATGLTQLWSAVENDWAKLRTYGIATLAFYPLQFVSLARYGGELDDGHGRWLYAGALLVLLTLQAAACAIHLQRDARLQGMAPSET